MVFNDDDVVAEVNELREDIAQDDEPAVFLENVLDATGQTMDELQKTVVINTLTREQIMRKFVAAN